MAFGTAFNEANIDMGAPKGMEDQVYSLPVMMGIDTASNQPCTVAHWEFEPREAEAMIKRYNETGKMTAYNCVWGGLPPMFLAGELPTQVRSYTAEEIIELQNKVKQNGATQ